MSLQTLPPDVANEGLRIYDDDGLPRAARQQEASMYQAGPLAEGEGRRKEGERGDLNGLLLISF
jgi:hypothetical protein